MFRYVTVANVALFAVFSVGRIGWIGYTGEGGRIGGTVARSSAVECNLFLRDTDMARTKKFRAWVLRNKVDGMYIRDDYFTMFETESSKFPSESSAREYLESRPPGARRNVEVVLIEYRA
jgi:hypothetical protein